MKKKKHLICVTVVSHAGCITEVGTGVGPAYHLLDSGVVPWAAAP